MKVLGYIVTDKKIKNIEGFVGQVNDISEADSTKPILIVGWENAKQFEGYNILDRKLSDGVFWTFSKYENRFEFENDLKKFYRYIIDNITKNTIYYYINIYNLRYSRLKRLYNIINSSEYKNIYISGNMIYFVHEGKVFGLAFQMFEYCGISREKIINRIKSNRFNNIIYDTSKNAIRIGRLLGNKKYALPYFV